MSIVAALINVSIDIVNVSSNDASEDSKKCGVEVVKSILVFFGK